MFLMELPLLRFISLHHSLGRLYVFPRLFYSLFISQQSSIPLREAFRLVYPESQG